MLSTWLICVFYSCVAGIGGTAARQSWYDTITDTSTNFKPVALTADLDLNPAISDDPASIRTNGPDWIRIMKRSDQGLLAMVRQKHGRGQLLRLKGYWSWYPAFFFRLA